MNKQEKMIVTLSSIAFLIACVGYYYLPEILITLRPRNANFIGMVVETTGDVKMRFGDSINWMKVQKKDRIYSRVYLFTGEKSSGKYALLDKSFITLGQNSLIYLDFVVSDKTILQEAKTHPLGIDLIDGKMVIDLKDDSHLRKIKVDNAVIDISDKKTTVKLTNEEKAGMEISVMQGDINISKDDTQYSVKPGEKVGVSKQDDSIKKEAVSNEDMEEMKRIQESDRERIMSEILDSRISLEGALKDILYFLMPK